MVEASFLFLESTNMSYFFEAKFACIVDKRAKKSNNLLQIDITPLDFGLYFFPVVS